MEIYYFMYKNKKNIHNKNKMKKMKGMIIYGKFDTSRITKFTTFNWSP